MAIARRRRRTSVLIALAGVVVVAGAALASPSAAAPSRPPVDRVLVISLPAVSWADLQGVPLPHLRPLLDQSAVASLSVRAVRRATTAGDGY
ncbi:MAG: hypothetical protein M3R01_07225, partial [Actinomycetota bacterium]|nr:hypothetical protein [Actinomycetota bacterium]